VSSFDQQTLAFYESEARVYLGHRPDDVSDELLPFLDLLPRGANILELGCGGGRDAAFMLARGFTVDATDGVAAMAAEAQRYLGRPVRVMRFDELAAENSYDGVIALASLLHVPVDELPTALTLIWRALKPGGLHLATFKTGCAASRDEHGRYYNYVSRDEAEAAYRSAGDWTSLDFKEHMGVGYFSAPARWLTVVAQKGDPYSPIDSPVS
jgi:SAM-dependent methyltransferase